VGQQNTLQTVPVLLVAWDLGRLQLPSSEVWDAVDDVPRQRSGEIHELVQDEKHDTGGQDVVVHVAVPGGPVLLNQR